MHYSTIKLKDGRTIYGAIWTWFPKEGYFTVAGDEVYGTDPIAFADIESAIEPNQRVSIKEIRDVDLLQLAREGGWDGETAPPTSRFLPQPYRETSVNYEGYYDAEENWHRLTEEECLERWLQYHNDPVWVAMQTGVPCEIEIQGLDTLGDNP